MSGLAQNLTVDGKRRFGAAVPGEARSALEAGLSQRGREVRLVKDTANRARETIGSLTALAPAAATVMRGDREERRPVSELKVGDHLIVLPGERLAMDGVVVAGESAVNQAPITGESRLVDKLPGLIAKLDSTLTRLDATANSANGILTDNRAAINSFANDGLSQLGPTLGELRSLVRDLRRLSDRVEGNPTRFLLGRDAPKEFEPQ